MNTLRETFLEELADIYDAEKQLIQALPKVARAAEHEELRQGIEEHLEQTREHADRIEQVFEILEEKAKTRKCKAMQGLLAEGKELMDEKAGDAALICAAQKVEHYEIATYGSLVSWAKLLGEEDAANLLEETLEEEKETDERLTEIAESSINVEEAQGEGREEEGSKRRGAKAR